MKNGQHPWRHILFSKDLQVLAVTSLTLLALFATSRSPAATRVVWQGSASDGPGNTWANAFHTIQAAVDASTAGDTVLVTNGVYAAGGGSVPENPCMSRVCVTNAIHVQSVHGPEYTTISGAPDPSTSGCGSNAVRSVLLTPGAAFSGFCVTGGWTRAAGNAAVERAGGGIYLLNGGVVSNCVIARNTADGNGGGLYFYLGGELYDSQIVSNSADRGGGLFSRSGFINECEIRNNRAVQTGGGIHARNATVVESCDVGFNKVTGNSTCDGAGILATESAEVRECRIYCNEATGTYGTGGGIILYYGGLIEHSVIYSNESEYTGGGVALYAGKPKGHGMNNCLVFRNTCRSYGGGVYCYAGGGPIVNCTISENTSQYYYGGVNCNYTGIFYNTVIYYNTASVGRDEIGGNHGVAYNCCIPTNHGFIVCQNLITNDPQFVDRPGCNFRLLPASPCMDTGRDSAVENLYDLDGRYRIMGPHVDRGCYEYGFMSTAMVPPAILSPVAVPSGGSGVCRITNDTSFTISGNKAADELVGTPTRTNGLVQTTGTGETSWTHPALPLSPPPGAITNIYLYASVTPDLTTCSSNQTTLTVIGHRVPGMITITNTDSWVTYDVTSTSIGGTNNPWVVGTMTWSNSKGGSGVLPAASTWCATGIVLAAGANVISVQGTNVFGDTTNDSVTVTRWGEGTGEPLIGITDAPDWIYYDESQATVAGTNRNIAGKLWWVNDRAPAVTNFFDTGFSVKVKNLELGDNMITVSGTNLFGTPASDSVTIYRQTMDDRMASTNYVWRDSPYTPAPPYASWSTAATSIHDAVYAAAGGLTGTVVVVTNGTYRFSQWVRLTNTVLVTSVNGPEGTIVDGGFPVVTSRCFTINHSLAVVEGFTISNAYWDPNGGGAFIGQNGGTIRHCIFTDCTAGEKGGGLYLNRAGRVEDCRFTRCTANTWGGGIHMEQGGAVYNSVIKGCYATTFGGGISIYGGGRIYSCLITRNTANRGGGLYTRYYPSRLDNCTIASNTALTAAGGLYIREGPDMRGSIVWGNRAPTNANWYKYGSIKVQDSCTTPKLGANCITNDPCFINFDAGNYRLVPVSFCIDAAPSYKWMDGATDLDGAPRIMGAAVDLGCYESDPMNDWDGDTIPDGWERKYGMNPTNPCAPTANTDGDPFTDVEEYGADTNPTNPLSYFCICAMSTDSPIEVWFLSSSNRLYTLYCAGTLGGEWTNVPGQGPRMGAGGMDCLTDTNTFQQRYYKLGVHPAQ